MDPLAIGIIGTVVMIGLILCGVHVAFALGAVGTVGLFMIVGVDRAISMITSISFHNINTIDFTVLPLFVLMGMLATSVGASTAAYDCLAKWLGKVPGGLGVATVGGCAAFGTLNGSAIVTASVFAKAAVPEMRKYGYNKKIAYGLVCGAGCIGQLIPPSVLIVIYGALSGDSIGRLLMAGISPGLALTLGFCVLIVAAAIIKPQLAPKANVTYPMKEKLKSLTGLIPIAVAALVIIGGIFSGLFSSSEAGAIGCVVFFIYAIIFRAPWSKVKEAVEETVVNCGMLFIILVCSGIFAKFLTVSTLADALVGVVTRIHMAPVVFMLVCFVIYLILGCLLDSVSILSLSIPIFQPVMNALGIDPIHFAMFAILALHCGTLTPPVGLVCFSVKAVADKDTTLGDIFAGAMPFLAVMVVITLIYIFIPDLSTFLPDLMMK